MAANKYLFFQSITLIFMAPRDADRIGISSRRASCFIYMRLRFPGAKKNKQIIQQHAKLRKAREVDNAMEGSAGN